MKSVPSNIKNHGLISPQLLHDDKVDRTTNDNGYVRDLTFEELKHKFIDEEVVVECHKNDIGVNAWTVNDIEDIERMKELDVDIISSDYPDRVLEELITYSH